MEYPSLYDDPLEISDVETTLGDAEPDLEGHGTVASDKLDAVEYVPLVNVKPLPEEDTVELPEDTVKLPEDTVELLEDTVELPEESPDGELPLEEAE